MSYPPLAHARYEDATKGKTINTKDYLVKVTVKKETTEISGTHITGSEAFILIQEIINRIFTPGQSSVPIANGMPIHPVLTEAT
ncbi:hypothetical protein E3J49_03595 [Candidatus Bathyarchaeota archaeon]|nr:MAG: hypothetical protein E3J49_03595 [Candidatus Bathyarchaeota archaeon]